MALTATYTVEKTWIPWGPGAGMRHRRVKIAIPGSETYGTGLAVSKTSVGCPTVIESLMVLGGDTPGAPWVWDRDSEVLRLFETAAAAEGVLAEADSADTPAAQNL